MLILLISAYTQKERNNVRGPGLGLRVLGVGGLSTNGLRVGDALVVRSSVVGVFVFTIGQSVLAIGQAVGLISSTLLGQLEVLGLVDQFRLVLTHVMGVVLSSRHRVGVNSWDLRFRVFWYDRFRRR